MPNDPQTYHEYARAAIQQLSEMSRPFTSDHVRSMIPAPVSMRHHPNTLSSIFASAQRAGTIRSIGTTKSYRKKRRGGRVNMWVGANSPLRTTQEHLQDRNEELEQECDILAEALLKVYEIIQKFKTTDDPVMKMMVGELEEAVIHLKEEEEQE